MPSCSCLLQAFACSRPALLALAQYTAIKKNSVNNSYWRCLFPSAFFSATQLMHFLKGPPFSSPSGACACAMLAIAFFQKSSPWQWAKNQFRERWVQASSPSAPSASCGKESHGHKRKKKVALCCPAVAAARKGQLYASSAQSCRVAC